MIKSENKFFWFMTVLLSGIVVMSIMGCGGGGGDSSSVSIIPPSQNIIGTYTFKSTVIKYSNGTTLTEKDVPITGTMKLGSNTLSQTMTLNNNTYTVSGQYTSSFNSAASTGTLHITDTTGTHDVTFSITGNDMTTYSGISVLGNGLTYKEWDTWTKVDNNVAAKASTSGNHIIWQEQYIWIGDLLQ